MTTLPMDTHHVPTVEVTERSDGHVMPFLVGMILVLVSGIVSIMATGLPH